MRTTSALLALALVAAAVPAAAQTQAPQPPPPKEEQPRLNLKLDQPARFYTSETPGEKPSEEKLPSLGDSAKPLERPAPARGDSTFSYPTDSQRR